MPSKVYPFETITEDPIECCLICKKDTPTSIAFSCGHLGHPACIYIQQHLERYFERINYHCPKCFVYFDHENMHSFFFDEIKAYALAEYNYSMALLHFSKRNEDAEKYLLNIPSDVALEIKRVIGSDHAVYQQATLRRDNEKIARYCYAQNQEEPLNCCRIS